MSLHATKPSWNYPCVLLLAAIVLGTARSAPAVVEDATWNGGGDGVSYSDPLNWNIGVVPVNDGLTEYNVTIPNSTSVTFDVDDPVTITDFSLGTGSTLTIDPTEELNVLDDALISGTITTAGGTFNAPSAASQFQSNQARMFASAGGQINVGALTYSHTRNDYRANLTLMSVDGVGSLLDLSSLQSFTSASYGHYGSFRYDVVARNSGVLDLSAVSSITGARTDNDDYLRFILETGGDIPLTLLTQITGRTLFDVNVDNYSLPALDTAANIYFTVQAGRTVNVPVLTSMSGSGTGVSLADGATFNAPQLTSLAGGPVSLGAAATLDTGALLSIDGSALSIGAGGNLNAPLLISLTNSTITRRPDQTFTHGAISNINGSEFAVEDGVSWVLDAVPEYTNTVNDHRAHLTLLSVDGPGSLLDLSSALSFTSYSYGWYGAWRYDVVARNSGVLDLSAVSSITGARTDAGDNNDYLRFILETGGDIPLTSLTQITGRTLFDVNVDNYSLPALDTAANTYFTVQAGRTLNVPALTSMSGSGTGISLADGATFTASQLTTMAGGPISLGAAATLDTGSLLSIDAAAISIGATGNLNAPLLVALTNSTITRHPDQTFTHGAISNINGSEFVVEDGVSWVLDAVPEYTNTVNDHRAHLTLLSVDGPGSLLDLSSALSFTSYSYGWYGAWRYDVVARNSGVLDLSAVSSITGARTDLGDNNDYLRFILETGGDIRLTSLTQTTGRTLFDVNVDGYSLPALETAANTYFTVQAGRTVNVPALVSMSGTGTGISLADGATFNASQLTTMAGGPIGLGAAATLDTGSLLSIDGAAISIGAAGNLNAPLLISLTNSTLTRRPDQTFTHGAISNINGSEFAVEDGVSWVLDAVPEYTNTFRSDAHFTLLSVDGPGSVLDLSSALSFTNASYGYYGAWRYDIVARNSGVLDLSSVSSITGARTDVGDNEDYLRFFIETGGDIPLTSLTQTTGRTMFDVNVDGYSLPVLDTASNTYFMIQAGRTLNLPALTSMSGTGTGISLADGATFNASQLTTMAGGPISLGAAATLDTGALLSIDSTALSIGATGNLNAPLLISLTNSTITRRPDQTFTHGAISNINGSEFFVEDGVSWVLDAVPEYTNSFRYDASRTLLSVDGSGSLLDLSSALSITSASYGYYGAWRYDVATRNGGVLDLSSASSITGARTDAGNNDDYLRFIIESGGHVDLSSLRSITGRVQFNVGADGTLDLGDMAVTSWTDLNVQSPSSDVNVNGSLYLDANSKLTIASGASIDLLGDLLFAYTDENQLATDAGIIHLLGSGIQFFEAGGEDLGLEGSAAGNFGFGRLLIGQEAEPTTVMLLDLMDNGNRTGGAAEALYLYGVGGLDGMELLGGSTLVLGGINCYAYQQGDWVYLNGLFAPGVKSIPYGDGTIEVPEPSTIILLALAAAAALLFRFRRRRV